MKTILTLIAATAVLGFAAPTSAKADGYCNGSRRIISYMPCGTPVYAVYQVVGYDHCGRPVGQWVTQRVPHSCGVCNPRPSYGFGHSHHHGYSGYSPGYNNNCRPSYGRSGISFSFGFGR
ncbi:hypothetical protein [Prosthecobacter sp.]|uniref:hypothetical protein n=1 Tax=Prosthecobacter sp. TaxID=1965333 RepID=UPI001D24AB92|nr:hypothetical protein [Prosthecobacter sp.]MCB1278103.1 hypothetical protein [Prosthecobacter sp.]